MKIAVTSQTAEAEDIIHSLLSPWRVSFTDPDEAEIVIIYNKEPTVHKKNIVIPSDSHFFANWTRSARLRVSRRTREKVSVAAGEKVALTIVPQVSYHYYGSVDSASMDDTATEVKLKENLVAVKLDIVREHNRILDETLHAKRSKAYQLLTGLPIPYSVAPKWIRDQFMKGHVKSKDLTLRDELPLDALRNVLLNAIERLSETKIARKTWNRKQFACIVTHDVDTQEGFRVSERIKKLEEKYDIQSAWYIPSRHYKLSSEIIKALTNHGEVGAHDTKHDGKLTSLPKRKIVERLEEAKRDLEKTTACSVDGFRAPLLQHSYETMQALHETGYLYDTSIPTWEPKHPYTMKPHGIGTVYPFTLGGTVEIPVTLPQDHQMIHSLGMNLNQSVKSWVMLMEETQRMGGLCVFLTHPNYELACPENLGTYESLLNAIATNNNADVALPRDVAKTLCD